VASGLVVLAMGDLPAEVRHKKSRVKGPTDRVVQNLGSAEGLVAALVGQHPHASTEQALNESIKGP